jgi:hypothetical protein
MKWIRTFRPGQLVEWFSIEPAPALGLVEVRTVGEGDKVTSIFHLDEGEAFAMYGALDAALGQLWPERRKLKP